MRKLIPQLDDSLTKDEFLKLIVEGFQSVVFGTIDQYGDPITNVADIEIKEKNKLIFAKRPEMKQISSNYSERREILRLFAITPIVGSIYDLRQQPIFQKKFKF